MVVTRTRGRPRKEKKEKEKEKPVTPEEDRFKVLLGRVDQIEAKMQRVDYFLTMLLNEPEGMMASINQ